MTDAPEFNQKISEESKTAAAFERFLNVIKCLRAKDGCPWDIKQTPLSMRTDLAEETFEAIDAISQEDVSHAKEELGDVLLNTLLISYMYEQNHDFTIEDAINEVAQKIIRRHPHVFHASEGSVCADGNVKNAQEVLVQWDKIKETVEGRGGSKSILDEVPKGFPPLLKAYKMQKKAAKKGFDWNELPPVKAKILEELAEVEQARQAVEKAEIEALKIDSEAKAFSTNSTQDLDKSRLALEEETGDLLFAVVNYSRHLGIDPGIALSRANQKFYRRFAFVEQAMKEKGLTMDQQNFKEMDSLWDLAKQQEKEN